ncbi:MAG: hypothetical protein CMI56_00145 [Parcubacteria group bacterium]|nr:hypothetical protein [Parcubacteria group bacterium]|tara:strand:- start:6752 stop:7018 length:267 start_codon:yes stop_codon:yes gene_type:complete
MERNAFQKIHEIIETSTLLPEEKRDFTELFAQTKESALKPVLKVLEANPELIAKLYTNYRIKKDAMVTGNMAAWEDAMEKEREELERI